MAFDSYGFSEVIMKFLEDCEIEPGILEIRDFYDEHIIEPSDITEKELYEFYVAPSRIIRRRQKFHNSALSFHAYAISRYIENDFDYVAVVAGTEGKGKSSFELESAEALQKLGIKYSLEDMLFRGSTAEEALKVISNLNRSQICFDEAKPFFDKRQSMNYDQVELIQEVTAQRKNNNIYWMCIGDVDEIDKYFRERRAREVVLIPDRKFFVSLHNMGIVGMGQDRFCLDRLNWLVTQQSELSYKMQISTLINLPSAHFVGHFPKVEKELFERYKAMKNEKNTYFRQMQKYKRFQRDKKKGPGERIGSLLKYGE